MLQRRISTNVCWGNQRIGSWNIVKWKSIHVVQSWVDGLGHYLRELKRDKFGPDGHKKLYIYNINEHIDVELTNLEYIQWGDKPGIVVEACNPSYLEGKYPEHHSSRAAQVKS
jgi:hypothetical protein